MQEKALGMEQKILKAAISCIEKYGLKGMTVRNIAVTANVNVSAINYYFRTKKQLLDKVFDLTLKNAFDWSDLLVYEELPPKEMILAIVKHLCDGAIAYPSITRAHFYEPMVNGNYETKAVMAINTFLETLIEKLKNKGCLIEESELRMMITEVFMAGIFATGTVPNLCEKFLGLDLKNKEQRSIYLEHLVNHLFIQ